MKYTWLGASFFVGVATVVYGSGVADNFEIKNNSEDTIFVNLERQNQTVYFGSDEKVPSGGFFARTIQSTNKVQNTLNNIRRITISAANNKKYEARIVNLDQDGIDKIYVKFSVKKGKKGDIGVLEPQMGTYRGLSGKTKDNVNLKHNIKKYNIVPATTSW